MLEEKVIAAGELAPYGPVDNLNAQAKTLVKQQRDTWELAGINYAALSEVQTRQFDFGHFQISVSHNPGRMRSSAAKTDPQSIARRPCFLCTHNLPPGQKGIPFNENYLILANPFPIFPVHLTISHLEHLPQRLEPFFPDMLELCRQLTGFTVFYNGPQCGASAPDHFHLQAGSIGFMPVEKEIARLKEKYATAVFKSGSMEIVAVENYLRRFLAFVSPQKDEIIQAFQYLCTSLMRDEQTEPMMNVLSYYEDGKWNVILFPRERQRPSHFFKTGRDQLLVSPAAVEMGGMLILPRHEDFISINHNFIAEVYREVTVSRESFECMIEMLSNWR